MPSWIRLRYSLPWPSTNVRPITKVIVNQRRSANTSPFSAANTPSWQVTEDSTRMIVFGVGGGRVSGSVCLAHSSGAAARIEKYIANNAAKNMSSLESQTIVPTLTMFGRVSEWIRLLSMAEAAVTGSLLPRDQLCVPRGVESGTSQSPVERVDTGKA